MARKKSVKVTKSEAEVEVVNEESSVIKSVEVLNNDEVVIEKHECEAETEQPKKEEEKHEVSEKREKSIISDIDKKVEFEEESLKENQKGANKFKEPIVDIKKIAKEHTVYDGQVPSSKIREKGRIFGFSWNGAEFDY